ncbi:MAG TPA: 3-deoxy-manno-octulosonate cytidylyltransferase [Candidatus Polarisedimenticolia bacterium]|nr:3-deoxy-manno-octulosonate cytidylyltransferase [Candidatus Polarisedimenticolia bacterium]
MPAVGVIPARYRSSRFPGKPLALIGGKTLVQWVFERAREARRLSRLLVATDDERIRCAVVGFGGEAMMTSDRHSTGTDRLAEVARRVPADLYVNIQGDEPLLEARDIDRLVECLENDPEIDMGTLREPITDARVAADSDVVKVVCDVRGRALYFSRSPIPAADTGAASAAGGTTDTGASWYRHVGLYAYRREFLLEFASWPPGRLETLERLEQLRALERGRSIRVLEALGRYHGVDTPRDVVEVERALAARS